MPNWTGWIDTPYCPWYDACELPVSRNTECGAIPQRSRHCNRGSLQQGDDTHRPLLSRYEGEKALQGIRSGSQETIPETNTLRGKRMASVRTFVPLHLPFSHSVRMQIEGLPRLPGDFRAKKCHLPARLLWEPACLRQTAPCAEVNADAINERAADPD